MANGNLSFLPITGEEEVPKTLPGPAIRAEGPDVPPATDLVAELLAQLEQPQTPTPPPRSFGRSALGGIGDALSAFASVSSGGGVPRQGAFAASEQAREQEFRDRTASLEDEQRGLRNRIKVGDFQARQEEGRRIRARKQQTQDQLAADKQKRNLDFQTNIRSAFIKEIIDKGITTDVDFLTASDKELKSILDSHDPQAANKILLSNIEPGFVATNIKVGEDGSITSFTIQPEGDPSKREVVTASQARMIIDAGVPPHILLKDPANIAAMLSAQENVQEDERQATARKQLDSALAVARREAELGNPIQEGMAESLAEISRLETLKAGDAELNEFYSAEVKEVVDAVRDADFSPEQGENFLAEIRQWMHIAFPDYQFPALSSIADTLAKERPEPSGPTTRTTEQETIEQLQKLNKKLQESGEKLIKSRPGDSPQGGGILGDVLKNLPEGVTDDEEKELKSLMDKISKRLDK